MDWNQLEKDINDNTALLLKQKSRLKRPQGLSDRGMVSLNPDANSTVIEDTVNISNIHVMENSHIGITDNSETEYLKMIVNKQQQQINNMEKSIFTLMSDHHKNKENNPYASEQQAVQQSLITRLVTMEENVKDVTDKYASKDALLQLLNGVMDQIRESNRCIDACSSQSRAVAQFSDAFLTALVEMSNSDSNSSGNNLNISSDRSGGGGDGNRSFNSSNRKRTALSLELLLGIGTDHGLNVSANSLSGPPPPNQALVDTLQEALTDAITRRIDATKTHLLRAVKPLILDSTSRTDDAMQDLQSSLSSQLNSHAAKLAAGAAHTEHLGQCMETGIQNLSQSIQNVSGMLHQFKVSVDGRAGSDSASDALYLPSRAELQRKQEQTQLELNELSKLVALKNKEIEAAALKVGSIESQYVDVSANLHHLSGSYEAFSSQTKDSIGSIDMSIKQLDASQSAHTQAVASKFSSLSADLSASCLAACTRETAHSNREMQFKMDDFCARQTAKLDDLQRSVKGDIKLVAEHAEGSLGRHLDRVAELEAKYTSPGGHIGSGSGGVSVDDILGSFELSAKISKCCEEFVGARLEVLKSNPVVATTVPESGSAGLSNTVMRIVNDRLAEHAEKIKSQQTAANATVLATSSGLMNSSLDTFKHEYVVPLTEQLRTTMFKDVQGLQQAMDTLQVEMGCLDDTISKEVSVEMRAQMQQVSRLASELTAAQEQLTELASTTIKDVEHDVARLKDTGCNVARACTMRLKALSSAPAGATGVPPPPPGEPTAAPPPVSQVSASVGAPAGVSPRHPHHGGFSVDVEDESCGSGNGDDAVTPYHVPGSQALDTGSSGSSRSGPEVSDDSGSESETENGSGRHIEERSELNDITRAGPGAAGVGHGANITPSRRSRGLLGDAMQQSRQYQTQVGVDIGPAAVGEATVQTNNPSLSVGLSTVKLAAPAAAMAGPPVTGPPAIHGYSDDSSDSDSSGHSSDGTDDDIGDVEVEEEEMLQSEEAERLRTENKYDYIINNAAKYTSSNNQKDVQQAAAVAATVDSSFAEDSFAESESDAGSSPQHKRSASPRLTVADTPPQSPGVAGVSVSSPSLSHSANVLSPLNNALTGSGDFASSPSKLNKMVLPGIGASAHATHGGLPHTLQPLSGAHNHGHGQLGKLERPPSFSPPPMTGSLGGSLGPPKPTGTGVGGTGVGGTGVGGTGVGAGVPDDASTDSNWDSDAGSANGGNSSGNSVGSGTGTGSGTGSVPIGTITTVPPKSSTTADAPKPSDIMSTHLALASARDNNASGNAGDRGSVSGRERPGPPLLRAVTTNSLVSDYSNMSKRPGSGGSVARGHAFGDDDSSSDESDSYSSDESQSQSPPPGILRVDTAEVEKGRSREVTLEALASAANSSTKEAALRTMSTMGGPPSLSRHNSLGSNSAQGTIPSPSMNSSSSTTQCPHCLKRIFRHELSEHFKTCELRIELCKYGCGSKILWKKMEKHKLVCPAVSAYDKEAAVAAGGAAAPPAVVVSTLTVANLEEHLEQSK